MDASNSLAVILGHHTIPVSDLSSEDRLAIVQAVLELVAPTMKYFPDGQVVEEWIRNPRFKGAYHYRRTDAAHLHLPLGVTLRTRMSCLAYIGSEHRNPDPTSTYGFYQTMSEWQLMLTRNGEVLLWSGEYKTYSEQGHGRRNHRTAYIEEALSSKFSLLTPNDLLELLGQYVGLCYDIVSQLHDWSRAALERRRKALRDLEEQERELGGIVSRFEKP